MVRLVELSPKWVIASFISARHGVEVRAHSFPGYEGFRVGMGVSFECPVHRTHRLVVPFENPIDGGPKAREGLGPNRDRWWTRAGDTFDALTITPSVNYRYLDANGDEQTHWHGCIRNGEVTSG